MFKKRQTHQKKANRVFIVIVILVYIVSKFHLKNVKKCLIFGTILTPLDPDPWAKMNADPDPQHWIIYFCLFRTSPSRCSFKAAPHHPGKMNERRKGLPQESKVHPTFMGGWEELFLCYTFFYFYGSLRPGEGLLQDLLWGRWEDLHPHLDDQWWKIECTGSGSDIKPVGN